MSVATGAVMEAPQPQSVGSRIIPAILKPKQASVRRNAAF
jgi:hypothetical protein